MHTSSGWRRTTLHDVIASYPSAHSGWQVLASLRAQCTPACRQAMEGTVAGMERVCVDAWRLAGAGGPSLSMRVAVTPQPAAASASIALMLESMEDAW